MFVCESVENVCYSYCKGIVQNICAISYHLDIFGVKFKAKQHIPTFYVKHSHIVSLSRYREALTTAHIHVVVVVVMYNSRTPIFLWIV